MWNKFNVYKIRWYYAKNKAQTKISIENMRELKISNKIDLIYFYDCIFYSILLIEWYSLRHPHTRNSLIKSFTKIAFETEFYLSILWHKIWFILKISIHIKNFYHILFHTCFLIFGLILDLSLTFDALHSSDNCSFYYFLVFTFIAALFKF